MNYTTKQPGLSSGIFLNWMWELPEVKLVSRKVELIVGC